MMDQADKLRKIVSGDKAVKLLEHTHAGSSVVAEVTENLAAASIVHNARVITITSGKGGVGKTNLAVNMALSMIESGLRVVILDADFGLANIEVILGTLPKYTLLDVIQNRKNLMEVLQQGPNNLRFISGGSGVEELARLSAADVQNFIKNINFLDRLFDVILVDTGAGVSENVLKMVLAADDVIVVTTPEPTAITDAYALIKMIAARDMKKKVKVVLNRADSQSEASEIFNKLKEVTGKFLGLQLESLGYLPQDSAVKRAVKLQKPFMISFPKSPIARQVRELSHRIAPEKSAEWKLQSNGAKNFIKKFMTFMSS